MTLSARCELRLAGVHPDLVRVVRNAAEGGARFRVTADGGVRTLEQQRRLFERGATKTMESRHLTGHAVDVVPLDDAGNVSWAWSLFFPLADAFRAASRSLMGRILSYSGRGILNHFSDISKMVATFKCRLKVQLLRIA